MLYKVPPQKWDKERMSEEFNQHVAPLTKNFFRNILDICV